mgnify:CR=1 FL=1
MLQLIFSILITRITQQSFNNPLPNECDVKAFYEAIEPEYGVKVLTSFGNLEDAEVILSPVKMDLGDYKVNVTRKTNNLYKIEGTDFYIETNYCYEYSYSDEAILTIESQYGYAKGKLIFK